MPIDASIPTMVRPGPAVDPMSALAQVMQLKQLQQQGVAQAQQVKLRDQQLQTGQLEIAAKQRTQAGQAALAAAIKDPSNRTPEGAVNHEQIASRLSEQFPDVAEAWLAQTSKNAEALDKLASTKRAHAEAAQEAIGSLAASASNEREFEASLGLLASQGVLDEATATKVAQQASDAGPEGWKAIRDQYVHLAPSARKAALTNQAELTKPRDLAPGHSFGVPGQPPVMMVPEKAPNPQTEKFLVDGKPVMGSFQPDSTGGKYMYLGQDVTARAKPIPAASTVINAGSAQNVKDAVAGMKEGTIPPVLPGRASKEYVELLAEARRQGYDLAAAATDWTATQKHFATLNGAQQTRLRQAISTASDSLDVIQNLADKWQGGKFPILNRVNLAAAKNGVYGKEAASIATQLEGQITDVTSELANVYMGGNSPTDHALKLAEKNLRSDWDQKVLTDMIGLARKNLQIRGNSIVNTEAITPTSQKTPPAVPAPTPPAVPPVAGAPSIGTERVVGGKSYVWTTKGTITGWYPK